MKRDAQNTPVIVNSISEMHREMGLPKPMHPLISLVNYTDINPSVEMFQKPLVLNFYKISYKQNKHGKFKYGQNYYDFEEGGLVFVSPNQLIANAGDEQDYSGYSLLIHPDFIRSYALGKRIKEFGFFSYSANEALFLSEKEKEVIISIFENIEKEISGTIDDFSQDVMISQIELLLNYSNRFYKRQFITRKAVSNDLLEKLESLLNDYFNNETALIKGIPTVHYFAEQLNLHQDT